MLKRSFSILAVAGLIFSTGVNAAELNPHRNPQELRSPMQPKLAHNYRIRHAYPRRQKFKKSRQSIIKIII